MHLELICSNMSLEATVKLKSKTPSGKGGQEQDALYASLKQKLIYRYPETFEQSRCYPTTIRLTWAFVSSRKSFGRK